MGAALCENVTPTMSPLSIFSRASPRAGRESTRRLEQWSRSMVQRVKEESLRAVLSKHRVARATWTRPDSKASERYLGDAMRCK